MREGLLMMLPRLYLNSSQNNSMNCRTQQSDQMAWASLPFDLMRLVIQALKKDGGIQQAAILRQVCKAWLQDFAQFPAEAVCPPSGDLERFCKILPAMTDLRVYQPQHGALDLQPLHAYPQITKLLIHENPEGPETGSLKLVNLPATISLVVLDSVQLPLPSTQAELLGITHLVCNDMLPAENALCQLLEKIPNLRVRC